MTAPSSAWLRSVVCLAAMSVAASLRAGNGGVDDVAKTATELRTAYAADIEKLAKECESQGLATEARRTRRVLTPTDPFKLYVRSLPETVGPEKLPAGAPANVVEWNAKLGQLRERHATALYDLARRAVRGGHAALAFHLLMAAAQADPDNESVRRSLGYQKYEDQWRTAYEVRKLRAGFVWSDKFGWLPKANLQRYEEGQRNVGGRWISAADDAARHRDIRSGWKIETEHYSILTNHSIEAGVQLGVKLERLHRLWRQMFLRFYASEADVAAMFDGRPRQPTTRHEIVYFRDRDDYNRALRTMEPRIEMSIGFYRAKSRRAYFFAGPASDDRTLYHEATHQLFSESRPVVPDIGGRGNFWIVEGIAMYMESLRREDGYYVLGGFDDLRLHAAQYRLLHDQFYVPLDEFVDLSMEKLQAIPPPRIGMMYSQAAGLTHFLIHDKEGRYRDALVAYLVAVYAGRDGHDTLAKLTGVDYSDLDKQYRAFLESGKAADKE